MKPSNNPQSTIETSDRSNFLFRSAIIATLAGSAACASPQAQRPKEPENRVVNKKKKAHCEDRTIKIISESDVTTVYEVCGNKFSATYTQRSLTYTTRQHGLKASSQQHGLGVSYEQHGLENSSTQHGLKASSKQYQLEADYSQYGFKPRYEVYPPPSDQDDDTFDEEKPAAEE